MPLPKVFWVTVAAAVVAADEDRCQTGAECEVDDTSSLQLPQGRGRSLLAEGHSPRLLSPVTIGGSPVALGLVRPPPMVPPSAPLGSRLLGSAKPRRSVANVSAQLGSSFLEPSRTDHDRLALRRLWERQRLATAAAEAEVAKNRWDLRLLQERLRAGNRTDRQRLLSFLWSGAVAKAHFVSTAAGDVAGHIHPWNPFHLIVKAMSTAIARSACVVLSFGIIVALSFQFARNAVEGSDGSLSSRYTKVFKEDDDDFCAPRMGKSCMNCCAHLLCDCSMRTKMLFWTTVISWWVGIGLLWHWQMLQPVMNQLAVALLFGSAIIMVTLMAIAELFVTVDEEVGHIFDFMSHLQKQMDTILKALGFDDGDPDDDDPDEGK